jgi:hypothetical protein
VNEEIEPLFADMGKTWDYLVADPQLRWCVHPFLDLSPSLGFIPGVVT